MLLFDTLSPYAPASEDELLAALGRATSGPDRVDVLRAANRALARMERFTRRKLMVRTYRTPVAVACTLTDSDETVAGSGFTTSVKVHDDVVAGSGVQPWSRVASIASASSLELNRKATATGPVTLSFGSAPLITSRVSEREVLIPERPVLEVYGASWKDEDGALTALDTTGARLVKSTGLYYLPNDTFPEGEQNIVIECAAGYVAPTGSSLGDPEVADLQHWLLRLTRIVMEDDKRGRAVSHVAGPMNANVPDFQMPDDVRRGLGQYARRW